MNCTRGRLPVRSRAPTSKASSIGASTAPKGPCATVSGLPSSAHPMAACCSGARARAISTPGLPIRRLGSSTHRTRRPEWSTSMQALRASLKRRRARGSRPRTPAGLRRHVLRPPRLDRDRVAKLSSAQVLRDRILAHVARQTDPELADVVIVRDPAEVDDPTIPPYARAKLRLVLYA